MLLSRDDTDTLHAARLLELLRERVHPSVYPCGAGVDHKGRTFYRFNYTDRTEPCYTGHAHEGSQNLRAFVTADGMGFAWCFSERCRDQGAFRLGQVYVDPPYHAAGAVEFEAPFLSSQQPGRISDDDTFDGAVRRWMDGSAACLSIKSPMGTGKTTLLDKLLQHPDLPHDNVLIVTYRQTLALEQQNKLEHLGFVNYMTLESRDISQELHPKLICQVESLFHLEKLDGMPAYHVSPPKKTRGQPDGLQLRPLRLGG